ncbi:MAG TPA: signal peptide peptidase SppA [Fibrobacteria bacterium]|nr:signal peptide peptidase SppA [Fibrobacteria bacterium]
MNMFDRERELRPDVRIDARRPGGWGWFGRVMAVLLVLGAVFFFLMVSSIAGMLGRFATPLPSGPYLLQLDITGPIYESETILSILRSVRDDEECKGVLVRVESPGGAVGSSQEIHASLNALRRDGMPLAVSLGNVAASGGYYVALAGERIFANPGTVTGSIGVIFQFPEVERLLDKAGVSLQTVKSGDLKDIGNPARKATPDEMTYLQTVIDDTYEQFLADVSAGRGLEVDSVRAHADGRIFTGRQALAAGLVDTLGGLDEARSWLITRAGVAEDIRWTREPRPRSRLEELLYPEAGESLAGLLNGLRRRMNPGTFFLWP